MIEERSAHKSELGDEAKYTAEEITSEAELTEYFQLYSKIWDYPSEHVSDKLRVYHEGNQQVYAVKNAAGKIIAGGKMRIVETAQGREAYFNNKIADPEYRGKALASVVNQARIKRAEHEGCDQAYALILKTNIKAIRSIFKDGFAIGKPHPEKYYEVPDTGPYFLACKKLSSVKQPATGEKIEILLNNTELIDAALNEGYIGTRLALPTDNDGGPEEPTMILYK